MSTSTPAARRSIPGNKIGAAVVWVVGAFMSFQFFDQITELDQGAILMLSVVVQLALTLAQSPVWRGRGGMIPYVALGVDAVINFGGVMFFMANIDQAGSVQALTGSLLGFTGSWPMFAKGLLALFFAAMVAGIPEFLWRLD